jgi:hypothetical protein
MHLSARKARHLNVGEVLVFGVISDPSLNVLASVGAAVEERGHGQLLATLALYPFIRSLRP